MKRTAQNPKSKYLTHDKEYEIKAVSAGGFYFVVNDKGRKKAYCKSNFKSI